MRQCMDADNLHRRLKKIIGQVQAIDKMKTADAGIAMGGIGSDIAVDAGNCSGACDSLRRRTAGNGNEKIFCMEKERQIHFSSCV